MMTATDMPTAAIPMISIRELCHFYGTGELRTCILDRVSLDIMPGEIVILTGPSGSGKTTLLTLSGALRSVQMGSVRILGRELLGASTRVREEIRKDVGVIFQAHNLIEALSARQNVALAMGLDAGLSNKERYARADAMLQAVGLGARLEHYPEQLSGGQKQRVAIARALVRRPRIILADEPTASLDRKSGREVIEILRELARSSGCAVLLVTHDNRILDLADRIVTLEDGRLVSLASEMSINAGSILRGFTRLSRTGDLRQHVGSLSDKQFADLLEALTSEFSQYLAVFQVGGRETIQELFDSILEATTAKMIDLMQADRGTLYLLDADKMILRSRIATGNAGEKIVIEVPVSHSLAGQVIRTGKPLNLDDVYQSENFNRAHDDATGYRTKSMLCMPIYTPAGHVLAVAQLINRKGDEKFSAADEERFIQFAEPLEVMLENCIQLQSQFLAATEAP